MHAVEAQTVTSAAYYLTRILVDRRKCLDGSLRLCVGLSRGSRRPRWPGGLLGSLGLDPPLAVPRGQEGEQLPLDEQTAHVTKLLRH